MPVPIPCAAGCDNGKVESEYLRSGRLVEAWTRIVDCPRCRGTGFEPCECCSRPTWQHPAVVMEECDRPEGMPVCQECHEQLEKERNAA